MVLDPAATPETNPVELLIVAALVFEEVQVPPKVASLKAVVLPAQTVVVPVMAAMVMLFPATQLEDEPVNAKLERVPLLELDVLSVSVEIPEFVPPDVP